jgi:tetratricopeptide (TPR) repeat protein
LGKKAEAIFANRKSITLAAGDNKNRVQASSYFNIAKIYEEEGQYADALANYTKANEAREMDVYRAAIERVNGKMKKPWWQFW